MAYRLRSPVLNLIIAERHTILEEQPPGLEELRERLLTDEAWLLRERLTGGPRYIVRPRDGVLLFVLLAVFCLGVRTLPLVNLHHRSRPTAAQMHL